VSWIIAENIEQAFGANEVFRGVSFRVGPEDRIGLVGPNGEGKTTLLRIMAGLLDSTRGQVHRRKNLRIGYLPQTPPALEGTTIRGAMVAVFAEVQRLELELHELADRLTGSGNHEELLKQYGAMQHQFETMGGYNYTTRIEQVMSGLGFVGEMADRPLDKLSGGQRTRVHLGTLLLQEPELLMLDEPTNHLDLDSVEWLEFWLRSFAGALIVVSHDRYFLDHVTNDTWEVAGGGLETYHGAYRHYLVQREERHKERMRRWEAQQEYVTKTEEFIAQHLAGQRSKEAQGRRTRLQRFLRDEGIARPEDRPTISLSLRATGRTGDYVYRAENLAVGYTPGAALLNVEKLEVERGQRIAIVGPNGIGKTTLMRTLLGELLPLGGTVRVGANVVPGYLSQTHGELDPASTALDSVMSAAVGLKEEAVRSLLGRLLLTGEDVFKKICELSGGQRSRVLLARLVVGSVNVLMLDEPTNHLDIPSCETIQEVLQGFDGTVLFVSHDRYLIQAVATDIWAVEDGRVTALCGGWEEYLLWRAARREQGSAAANAAETEGGLSESGASREERKADHREARKKANRLQSLRSRHEALETEIEKLEKSLEELMRQVTAASQAGDLAAVERHGAEYQAQEERLKVLWAEWAEVGGQIE
jgi:ATP-binding cassette subfamily F protein 3